MIAVALEERFMMAKSFPALGRKQPEELSRAIAQVHESAVEFSSSEVLAAGGRGAVLDEFRYLQIAHAHAEVLAGDIFNLVSLIENHRGIVGKNAAVGLIANGQIGKKQMMIHDDDVALRRPPVHRGDEAAVELLAFLA